MYQFFTIYYFLLSSPNHTPPKTQCILQSQHILIIHKYSITLASEFIFQKLLTYYDPTNRSFLN